MSTVGDIVGLVFTSEDLGEIEELIGAAYTSVRLTARPKDRHRYEVIRNVLGPISLDRLRCGFEMDFVGDPMGTIALIGVESGTFPRHVTDGVDDRYGPGEVFLAAQPDRPLAGRLCRPHYSVTMLEPALLSQVAATAPGRTDEPVRLTGHRPITPAAGRHLLHTIRFLRDRVASDPAIQDAALIASTAPQLLAATVLSTFPNTALTDPTIEDRHDAHPATLRRAIAFIDDHAHEDISAADIAAACHVTIRALQYAFRRHRGTTPMGYLRQARLHQAHQDLLAADPRSGDTVTQIAARWGFYHPGRFAHYYRIHYGHPPYQTLLRDHP